MIYLNANRAISNERASRPDDALRIFCRLLPEAHMPRIVCVVGERAGTAGAFVASVISASGACVGRYRSKALGLKEKFCVLPRGESVDRVICVIDQLCRSSVELGRAKNAKSNRIFDAVPLNAEELSCLCALHIFSDRRCDLAVIECSERFFDVILSRSSLPLEAVIFTSQDSAVTDRLIEIAPSHTREIIRLSDEDCFEHVSATRAKNGARISTVSPNKINTGRVGILGADFYYNSDFYQIRSPDRRIVPLASLAVELAFALDLCPSSIVNKGLRAAAPDEALELFSAYPLIFINTAGYTPDLDFLRGKNIKFIFEEGYNKNRTVTLDADSDALIVQGSRRFSEGIKNGLIKSIKYK